MRKQEIRKKWENLTEKEKIKFDGYKDFVDLEKQKEFMKK